MTLFGFYLRDGENAPALRERSLDTHLAISRSISNGLPSLGR